MANSPEGVIKSIDAVFFVIVAVVLLISFFFPRDYGTPLEMRGCYVSARGQKIELGKNDIKLGESLEDIFSVKFSRTNFGPQLNLNPGLVPKEDRQGALKFIRQEPGNVVKVSRDRLTFITDRQEEYFFQKMSC